VHGSPRLRDHCLIDAQVMTELKAAAAFAPLHTPAALAVIRFAEKHFAGLPQVACLDTCFHAAMPPVSSTLPLPRDLRAAGIQRYGFHGLSCESIVLSSSPSQLSHCRPGGYQARASLGNRVPSLAPCSPPHRPPARSGLCSMKPAGLTRLGGGHTQGAQPWRNRIQTGGRNRTCDGLRYRDGTTKAVRAHPGLPAAPGLNAEVTIAALNTTVVDFFDSRSELLSSLPTGPVADLLSGALLLVRRSLFDQAPTGDPVQLFTNSLGQIEGDLGARDPEDDPLIFEVVGSPAFGAVEVGVGGSYVYTPGSDFNGFDSFTV
jgi:hypothetical protein